MNNKNIMPSNGLCLKTIKTWIEEKDKDRIINENELKNINQFVNNKFKAEEGKAVFYLNYGIRFAKWNNNLLYFHTKEDNISEHLLEARIFNKNRELRIWKTCSEYRYRLRIDDVEGKDCDIIEANQNLWGTDTAPAGENWTKLTEARGTELIVPLTVTAEKGNSKPLAYVKTRNYIDYISGGQASFVDCRFVELKEKNKE